jgi:hypothetical protein
VKLKIYIYFFFAINTEQSAPDLGLATEDPDVRAFDKGEPFLSLLFILDMDCV